jgi:hypothetical protein
MSVTVAFLVAVGAVETGRDTVMFLTKEAVRLATSGFGHAIAELNGTIPLWQWIGQDHAVTFSY